MGQGRYDSHPSIDDPSIRFSVWNLNNIPLHTKVDKSRRRRASNWQLAPFLSRRGPHIRNLTNRLDQAASSFDRTKGSYAQETLRPIVCLAFVFPMLLIYELGSIFAESNIVKSGVDQWMRWWMDSLGVGQLVVLPLVTTGLLLVWHHRLEDHWRIRPMVLLGMLMESIGLGLILFFAGRGLFQFMADDTLPVMSLGPPLESIRWGAIICYIGCGVYEELLFRLILLNGLIWLGRQYLSTIQAGMLCGLATSLIFAALHYDFFNPAGGLFDIQGFWFRFFASCIFCLLFIFRGFGIAVGAHAAYDVLTQI